MRTELPLAVTLLLLPSAASAGWDCEQYYRVLGGVSRVERVEGAIRLTLLASERKAPCKELVYQKRTKTWKSERGEPCHALDQPPRCTEPIPELGLNTGILHFAASS